MPQPCKNSILEKTLTLAFAGRDVEAAFPGLRTRVGDRDETGMCLALTDGSTLPDRPTAMMEFGHEDLISPELEERLGGQLCWIRDSV
jgi:hypothetical protein